MKKRLLSALLALALVFVLLPTTALAGVTTGKEDYDISINGKGWKFDKEDNSDAYIPVYFYGNDPSRYFFSTEANDNWATNSNLKLTKEGNTVTITIRPKKRHISGNTIEFTLEKKSTTSGSPYDYTPCIEMGNNNNLVITGKGTLNITRDEKNGIGAALCSEVGDITITDGITVKANFLKQVSNSTVGNAISVKDHNLIISGKNTKVEARNSSCNIQDFYDASAAVCVENGEIKVSDGATLDAANSYTNPAGSQYSYYSCAISGDKDAPCTVSVTGENSCIIASAHNSTKHVNTSMGQAYRWAKFKVDGAKIEVGTSSPAQTITDINNIKNYKYAKISVPALEKDSYVSIAGESAVVGVETQIPTANGSGTYFYDQATKTLTLRDVNITSGTNAIQFKAAGTYTVNLEGTNTISNVSRGILAKSANQNITGNINVILSGSGSLDISAKGRAIEVPSGNLTFNNTGAITLATTNTTVGDMNAINVSGDISIGNDFNKNLKITAGNDTFDLKYSNFNDLNKYKSISFATPNSTISYGGTTLKQGEIIKDGKGGTATVDSKNNTITLNNFKGDKALVFNAEFTPNSITLIGDSTLSAVETKYQGLTISGSGSLTTGSIRVTNNYNIHADLTITDSATVIAGTTTSDAKAIDITGNLTVNSGATLTATNTSETNPTIDVSGNVTISGDPGTNAYTVSAHNSCDVQKDRVGNLSPSGVPSAIKIGGTLNISAGARVMAQTDSYGAGVMLGQNSTITVEDAFLSAQNSSCDFAAISFSGQTGKIDVSGENGEVVAENIHTGTNLAFRAINAFVYNRNTDFYLKMQSEGVIAEAKNKIIAPGEYDASGGKKVTITRGDEVTPVVIAGTPLLNDTYYTITNGSTVVANGSESNYNAFYDSANKTLKLNNAQISHSFAYEDGGGKDGAIIFTKFENYFIELSGENTISSTNTYAINCHRPDRTLTIKNAAGAENAKLTLTSNWMVVCSIGGLNIQSDVTMINTKKADYLMYVNGTFSFDGYNAYASANASGSPLEVYNPENYSTYKYLRITKETLETGGGSTHEHVFSTTSWESNADYHWHKCTVQGCTEVSDKEAHVYTNTWWKNSNGNHGRTCDKCRHEGEIHEFRKYYDFVDATYHVERCGYPNCTYVGSNETHSYDSFGTCKCGYNPNGLPAPPSLQGVAPTSENGTDGKILNSNIGMEYAQNLNGPWTKWNEHSNITGLSAGTYYVRYTKTDERFPDNQVATVEVPAYTPGGNPTPDIPAAPTGLVGVAPTSENGNGKITGTTAQMEYATSLEGDWTACANDSTDVPAGKYYVRMKKTDNTPAGEVVEVTVPAYSGTGEIVPPTPDNPGTIVIIRPAEEEKPAQQPNPSTGANDLVGMAVAAAVVAVLGSVALLRKHD